MADWQVDPLSFPAKQGPAHFFFFSGFLFLSRGRLTEGKWNGPVRQHPRRAKGSSLLLFAAPGGGWGWGLSEGFRVPVGENVVWLSGWEVSEGLALLVGCLWLSLLRCETGTDTHSVLQHSADAWLAARGRIGTAGHGQLNRAEQRSAEHLGARVASYCYCRSGDEQVTSQQQPHRVGVYNARAEVKQRDRCIGHRGGGRPAVQRSRVATRAVNKKPPAASTALRWQSLWPLGNGLVGAHAFRTAVLHGLPLGTTEYPSKQGTRLPG